MIPKIPGVVLLLVLICTFLCGCAETQGQETVLKDRLEAIPEDAIKITPDTDMFPPVLHSSEFESPIPLSGAVNTAGAEDSPFVTPGGETLYFFFTPDPNIPPEKQLLDGVTGIYASHRENGVLAPAKRVLLQDQGRLALDGCPFVTGDTMWFCSAREGYTGVNLFTAELLGGEWSNWQYTGEQMHRYEVGEMHITADGREMYFHSSRSGGKGGLDLWVTRFEGGAWQEPVNVAAVNTPENEGWPFVSADGRELWFTRTYQGSPAIFRATRAADVWGKPELILSTFAAEPTLDAEGNLYFVHHYFNNGTMVEADIYLARTR
jgi:hypothetical protein